MSAVVDASPAQSALRMDTETAGPEITTVDVSPPESSQQQNNLAGNGASPGQAGTQAGKDASSAKETTMTSQLPIIYGSQVLTEQQIEEAQTDANEIRGETASKHSENPDDTSTLEKDGSDTASVKSDDSVSLSAPSRLEDFDAKVRNTNFEQFKNFYTPEEIRPIVQVLYGGTSLELDIRKEEEKRGSTDLRKPAQELDVDKTVLHRIRIQSPSIIQHLYQAAGQNCQNPWRMHTFCRPFKVLVHFQPQMKDKLARLEEKWGRELDDNHAATDQEDYKAEEKVANAENSDLVDSKHALIHLQVYVKFIEEKVMPLYHMFSGSGTKPRKVRSTDLWYLFREGELVYSPIPHQKKKMRSEDYGSTANSSTLQASYQSCWKVYSIITPATPKDPDAIGDPVRDNDDDLLPGADDDLCTYDQTTRIWGYYIDYDGDSYRPVQREFKIRKFEGERDIKTLPVYPTKFLDDEEKFMLDRKASGETFKQYVENKHLYHRGWTLTHNPTGAALDDVDKYPEHIESEVIVDFAEAYQTVTSWEPEFHRPNIVQIGRWDTDWNSLGELNVRTYTPHCTNHDIILDACIRYDDIGGERRNQAISNDTFLSATRKGDDVTILEESFVLLPKRLMVFSFLQRKFINADINCLEVIDPDLNIFDKLSINPAHKQMVRSLVQEHFRKKKRRHEGKDVPYQDMIKGKGMGLVFLLHGVPGVGKTATAEAVAQENRKPLFSITCGDLGFKPGDVEKNLSRIFRLANLWDCILLLDEADVFFTKRAPNELERNALVTVFLRILEYYSGILFLTTNRVGIIDEAFKSRIHMSLYYPPLDWDQYKQIFQLNITRIEEIEAANEAYGERRVAIDSNSILQWSEKHFRETNDEVGRWNGRQIKNAFQISASLAHYDLLEASAADAQSFSTPPRNIRDSKPGILDAAQFKAVAQATLEFDKYMAYTKKGSDNVLAKRDRIRNDPRLAAGVPTATSGLHMHEHHHREVPTYQGTPTHGGGGATYSQGRSTYAPPPRDGYRDTYYNDPFYSSPETPRRLPPADDQYYGQSPPPRQAHEAGIPLEYGRRSYPPDDRHGGDGYERDMRGDGLGGGGGGGGGIPPRQLHVDDGAGNVYGRGAGSYGQPPPDSNYRGPPDARY